MTIMRVLTIRIMMMRMMMTLSVLRCGLVSDSKAGEPGSYSARIVFESAIRVKISTIISSVFISSSIIFIITVIIITTSIIVITTMITMIVIMISIMLIVK